MGEVSGHEDVLVVRRNVLQLGVVSVVNAHSNHVSALSLQQIGLLLNVGGVWIEKVYLLVKVVQVTRKICIIPSGPVFRGIRAG